MVTATRPAMESRPLLLALSDERVAGALAWAVWGLTAGLLAAAAVLFMLNRLP